MLTEFAVAFSGEWAPLEGVGAVGGSVLTGFAGAFSGEWTPFEEVGAGGGSVLAWFAGAFSGEWAPLEGVGAVGGSVLDRPSPRSVECGGCVPEVKPGLAAASSRFQA
ncbi:hypothetical protein BJ970_000080 [Saccharopolyspora phatthalungensis]|uniref:Uncharacterized protein n=1 Tax=Saccharopolyspora phatthalungensis TaxID=664693 RepID=A0A840PW44_9PSEU|nr:hypothetical protein [Saccharopolyspora phatthalungensis]